MNTLNSRDIFYPPYLNNNYRVYLRNDIDQKQYKQDLSNLYIELNRADDALKNWFEKLNEQLQVASVISILQEWDKKLERKQNLAGVYYAMGIISEFQKNEVNALQLLKNEQPQLIEKFTQLSEELLTVSRINLCIPYDDIPLVLQSLSAEIFADPKIKNAIERVEALLVAPKEKIIKYPTLIIYLQNKSIETIDDLNYLLEKFNNYFNEHLQQTQIDNTFADPWTSFVNVTQGFKLHKVYLNSLGVIDQVYSKESGFAYRISNHLTKKKFGTVPVRNLLIKNLVTNE